MATEEIKWCVKHNSAATGQTDRCQHVLNVALRTGVNPFDIYNNRRFGGSCVLRPATVEVSDGD